MDIQQQKQNLLDEINLIHKRRLKQIRAGEIGVDKGNKRYEQYEIEFQKNSNAVFNKIINTISADYDKFYDNMTKENKGYDFKNTLEQVFVFEFAGIGFNLMKQIASSKEITAYKIAYDNIKNILNKYELLHRDIKKCLYVMAIMHVVTNL